MTLDKIDHERYNTEQSSVVMPTVSKLVDTPNIVVYSSENVTIEYYITVTVRILITYESTHTHTHTHTRHQKEKTTPEDTHSRKHLSL